MRALRLSVLFAVTIGVASLAAQTASRSSAPGTRKPAAATSKSATLRTPWGAPDLQGTWDFRTVTPLERPAELAGKATLTEKEAAEYERRMVEQRNADNRHDKTPRRTVNGTAETEDVALAYNDFWWDRGTKVVGTRRTSLIVDPADGRIPPLTPEAQKRLADDDALRARIAEGPEDRSIAERCIMGFNAGPPMTPGGYNQNVQIVQHTDYVVLLNEMIHNARIIPLDDRPRLNVPQWVGESRGHWEGDTLVIDTRNFHQNTSLRGSSPNMHLVERITRVDADNLLYEFTVDDPTTWTKPWTAQVPMVKSEGLIYEYACHEGNYGMFGILSGARAIENKAKKAAVKSGTPR
jgi:hypothetical protein